MMEVKVTITRFDASRDVAPYPQSFSLEVRESQTVLDVLLDLAAEHDPSLAFRRACRSGICGACGVTLNGVPKLACETLVRDVVRDGEIEIGPLPHFGVLKDLVVDMDGFLEALRGVVPWLVLDPSYGGNMSQEGLLKVVKAGECILCGVCQADGSAEEGDPSAQLNPAAAVKAFRYAFDPRDILGPERAKLALDLGLLDRPLDPKGKLGCPKQIDFAHQIIPGLRQAVER